MQESPEKAAKPPLPPIPAKRYFTIGEVSDLCGVKPHVLRYWEQEFTQLKPVKRRGNRRYYQHHEVLLIRRIRDLLYEQGFTINGARNRLEEIDVRAEAITAPEVNVRPFVPPVVETAQLEFSAAGAVPDFDWSGLRRELTEVSQLLQVAATLS